MKSRYLLRSIQIGRRSSIARSKAPPIRSAYSTSSLAMANERISAPRAAKAVGLLPTYLADARAVQKYSPETPDGALQLSVAENQMLEDLLVPGLTGMYSSMEFPADAIYYQPTHGRPNTREAMAKYLQDLLGLSGAIDADGIVLGAGCNAVLENLCISLAEPGEGVLIPTPYYAAFEFDLVARAGLSIVPAPTMDYQDFDANSPIPEHAYYPNAASLDAAVAAAEQDGITPRILLLSHPMNPLGICYPPEVVQEIVDWCRDRKVHLVSDEIYAGSVYRKDSANFVSALEVAATENSDGNLGLGPYIHLVYAFSKDFALSGLRVGALYSENPEIRLPLQKLNDLCSISSQTQLLVEGMLTSSSSVNPEMKWTKEFLDENHSRLRARGDAWQACLDEIGIPYLKGTAGLFIWMDFSEFLPEGGSDDERERALYLQLLKEYGLLFTPGSSMKTERPGFFRCVFTAASDHEFELGMERLKDYVRSNRA